DNIVDAGFKGEISLINPRYDEIDGRPCLRTLSDLASAPDLLVMAAPAEHVAAQVEEAERIGVPGALVMTRDPAGWRGGEMTERLKKVAQRGRMRIIGPNCLGMLAPKAGLNASLSAQQAPTGDLAVVSQSGAIGSALLAWAQNRSVGFSGMVSAGEMVDVDFGDLLDYFALDVGTRAILLYIDRLEDPQKFMSAARAAARV
ncbi:MAG: CoA-binding protein, partial [Anaerolineae bacterium]|nr:CoA-binding protein [Anaerolineae bacterium]